MWFRGYGSGATPSVKRKPRPTSRGFFVAWCLFFNIATMNDSQEYSYPDPKHYSFPAGELTVEMRMSRWADGQTIAGTLHFTATFKDGSTTWAQVEHPERLIAEYSFRSFDQKDAAYWFTQLRKSYLHAPKA
jgi:hypothetical protein